MIELREKDHVLVQAPKTADLSGVVVAIRKTRVKIRTKIRFGPEGEWFTSYHLMSPGDVTMVIRDEVLIFNKRKNRGILGALA